MSDKEKLIYVFVALSSAIYVLESYFPRPLPWIKIGFANIIILIAVYLFSLRTVLLIIFLRVLVGSLITGTLFTPTFFLSLFSGITSGIVMYFFKIIPEKLISPLGISIIGAEIHIFSQLLLVYIFIIRDKIIFQLTPFLILFSLFTGIITGYISKKVIFKLK